MNSIQSFKTYHTIFQMVVMRMMERNTMYTYCILLLHMVTQENSTVRVQKYMINKICLARFCFNALNIIIKRCVFFRIPQIYDRLRLQDMLNVPRGEQELRKYDRGCQFRVVTMFREVHQTVRMRTTTFYLMNVPLIFV